MYVLFICTTKLSQNMYDEKYTNKLTEMPTIISVQEMLCDLADIRLIRSRTTRTPLTRTIFNKRSHQNVFYL